MPMANVCVCMYVFHLACTMARLNQTNQVYDLQIFPEFELINAMVESTVDRRFKLLLLHPI